jgi:hypothetical protein
MKKYEAAAQVVLNKYLRETRYYGYFELKWTDKSYMPFAKIEQVQYEGLPAMEKEGLVWKFSDMDPRPKPCDCISAPPLPSYVVISFGRCFFFIRIDKIIDMRHDGKVSITKAESREIAEKIVDY